MRSLRRSSKRILNKRSLDTVASGGFLTAGAEGLNNESVKVSKLITVLYAPHNCVVRDLNQLYTIR